MEKKEEMVSDMLFVEKSCTKWKQTIIPKLLPVSHSSEAADGDRQFPPLEIQCSYYFPRQDNINNITLTGENVYMDLTERNPLLLFTKLNGLHIYLSSVKSFVPKLSVYKFGADDKITFAPVLSHSLIIRGH